MVIGHEKRSFLSHVTTVNIALVGLWLFLAIGQIGSEQSGFRNIGLMPSKAAKSSDVPSGLKRPTTREEMYEDLKTLVPERPTVVEIGVWRGANALNMYKSLKPGKLLLADLWADTPDPRYRATNEDLVRAKFANGISNKTVDVFKGRSLDAVKRLKPNSVDVLYLDTLHDYILARQEMVALHGFVAKSGYFCGHDFVQPLGKEDSFGVIAAVTDFALEEGWAFTHVSSEDITTKEASRPGPRSFCIRRIEGPSGLN